jgi:hypothetical protein
MFIPLLSSSLSTLDSLGAAAATFRTSFSQKVVHAPSPLRLAVMFAVVRSFSPWFDIGLSNQPYVGPPNLLGLF